MAHALADTTQVKEMIIDALNLPDVQAQDIADEDPLFVEGLGLDSVDALELVLAIEQKYGLQIEDDSIGKEAFGSAAALTRFINDRLQAESV